MLDKLKKPFPPELISWRVGATTGDKKKGIPLAYIDARDVMERLDEVCGVGGWQNRYPMKGCCEIGVFIRGEWVWKTNGAGETQVEADKGQYSDAFKRAAVLWGIGRYLYDVENKWVEISPAGRSHKIKNPNSDELKEMLAKAARGIRVANVIPDEPEEDIRTRLNSVLVKIEKTATPEEMRGISVSEEVRKLWDELSEAQKVYYNGKFNTKMASFQPMAAE